MVRKIILRSGRGKGSFPVPPTPPTPPTSMPPAVNAPVQGTDLTSVYNLKFGGTGPRTSPANGTWSGSIDAYLASLGFTHANNNGALYLPVGVSTVTVERYSFRNAPRIQINGSAPGKINFNDCDLDNVAQVFGTSLTYTDINGNIQTGGDLPVDFNFCRYNISTFFAAGTGHWRWINCRFANQIQGLGDTSVGGTFTFQDCYITGGGCNPPAASHVELHRAGSSVFNYIGCMLDFVDGQANLPPTVPNYGWTGVLSLDCPVVNVTDCIFIGITEVNANPLNPDRIGPCVGYSDTSNVTITNCIMERGAFGAYTLNLNANAGGMTRPTDGGGNRSFANTAITDSTPGWN